MIRESAFRAKGGLGPSGMDADGWCRTITSNNFGASRSDLRKTFGNVV